MKSASQPTTGWPTGLEPGQRGAVRVCLSQPSRSYSLIDQHAAELTQCYWLVSIYLSLIARFMGPLWGPSGADRTPCWPHQLCYLGSWSYFSLQSKVVLFQTSDLNNWCTHFETTNMTYYLYLLISSHGLLKLWVNDVDEKNIIPYESMNVIHFHME